MSTELRPGDQQVDELDDPEPSRRYALGVVALVAVLALAVGAAAGFLLGRPAYPGDTSIDAGFARDMSTHHGQGVDMAMTMYRGAQDVGLRQVALDIGLTQQGQIGIFQAWLDQWGLSPTGTQKPMAWMAGHSHGTAPEQSMTLRPDGLMPGMATQTELQRLREARGRTQEILFCQLMIRHHEAGVAMAQMAATGASQPAVRRMAQQIVDGQNYEIQVLTAELTERGAKPLP